MFPLFSTGITTPAVSVAKFAAGVVDTSFAPKLSANVQKNLKSPLCYF
jgi:hypothetical protein